MSSLLPDKDDQTEFLGTKGHFPKRRSALCRGDRLLRSSARSRMTPQPCWWRAEKALLVHQRPPKGEALSATSQWQSSRKPWEGAGSGTGWE